MSPQNVANLCVRCETKFDKWVEYHRHVTELKCARHIKPYNLTGRSKAQIVIDWESKQKEGALI
jgi:hypothetical protein